MSPNSELQETALPAKSLDPTCYFLKPALCRYTITEFLRRAAIAMPTFDPSAFGDEIDRLIHAETKKWDVSGVPPDRLEHCLVTGINMAKTAYRHAPIETQVHIALWTALCVCVDDFDPGTSAIAEFAERFHAGLEQLHPLLDLYADILRWMPKFFGPYGAAAIVTSTVQFVTSTLVDKETDTMKLHHSARGYPLYKRNRNGVSEAYAFCICDKVHFSDVATHIQVTPEAIAYISHANDLFSFYKEELVGEKSNYVHDRACITGKDLEASLMDMLEDVVDVVDRGRKILEGEKERQAWESFLAGYVAFHFISPRYKLERLFNASD
ncbi:uncharacterized protein PHACADRAFT_211256 [Phanerochaete carnosa HHB-10118-sp]|uniref:Terpene synthase n=1 Tax=Phanerochaete carnosa (strain HHB-10118-sp) TaxID=650164 RepID=K5VQ23_PHACS|nr:uncharacterized protein PHACADRAFT_211256 [Phanerochaete carnosa HHB-10118-sp]EKM53583.1 hypothetical protein PHACADRAFT_211256 [Phanerochaete carnosa HHB-10118-sp]